MNLLNSQAGRGGGGGGGALGSGGVGPRQVAITITENERNAIDRVSFTDGADF